MASVSRVYVRLVATGLLAVAAGAQARSDLRPPLAETHACEAIGRYCLQSNPWVNLHHRLLHEAQFGSAPPTALAGAKLDEWRALVGRYRSHFGERSPTFDPELVAINAALSANREDRVPDAVPPEPKAVLERAMPFYRQAQWKKDDRGNRFYIALARPLLLQVAPEVVAAHEKAYARPFPTRILVDVTGRAGRFGAYSIGWGDEAHVVQSHTQPTMQGLAILESLVHEPSHSIVDAERGAIGEDLVRAAAATKVEPRANLWHALLFYTTGELVRRAYARRGIEYAPVIEQRYDGPFVGMRAPFEAHWKAYLDGRLARDEAMRKLLVETTAALPAR